MKTGSRIRTNIVLVTILFLLFQWILFSIVFAQFRMFELISYLFYPIALLFHLLVCFILIKFERLFIFLPSKKPLTHINLANLLTLFRLSSLPSICVFLILAADYPIKVFTIVLMGLAFITDLLDGLVSRTQNQITEIGKHLDSFSDYLSINVAAIALVVLGFLPLWLFILILVRGIQMLIGITYFLLSSGKYVYKTTFLGRASVFGVMVLYGIELLKLVCEPLRLSPVVPIIEYTTGLFLFLSLIDKVVLMMKKVKKGEHLKSGETAN